MSFRKAHLTGYTSALTVTEEQRSLRLLLLLGEWYFSVYKAFDQDAKDLRKQHD